MPFDTSYIAPADTARAVEAAGGKEAYDQLLRELPSRVPASELPVYIRGLENPQTEYETVRALKSEQQTRDRAAASLTPTTVADYKRLERRAIDGDPAARAAIAKLDVSNLR